MIYFHHNLLPRLEREYFTYLNDGPARISRGGLARDLPLPARESERERKVLERHIFTIFFIENFRIKDVHLIVMSNARKLILTQRYTHIQREIFHAQYNLIADIHTLTIHEQAKIHIKKVFQLLQCLDKQGQPHLALAQLFIV